MCACLLLGGSGAVGLAQTAPGDVLVGVTWPDGTLVSFDPASGAILERHVPIDPDSVESFIALAYDRNHGKLYVLSQGDHLLYTLDRDTLQLANVTPLRIDRTPDVTDVTSLAYDPVTGTLYTTIGHWDNYPAGPIRTDLASVDAWTGEVTVLGRIDGPWITSLAFSETERVLYALGVHEVGPWDSPDTTQVIRIDPATAAFSTVSATSYHTMLGMAFKEPGSFYSWINGAGHVFGQTDLQVPGLSTLAGDDATGPMSAMILRTFDLAQAPTEPDSSPAGFLFSGHVTEVSDPRGRLRGRIRPGQSFRGQLNYDAAVPFLGVVSGEITGGVSLQSGKLRYSAQGYAAELVNDRLDPSDTGPTDEFRLQGYAASGAVVSWTLVDRSGNAVDAGGTLPLAFDLSRWPTNTFSVAQYDPCCGEPIYRFTGRVDEIRRRPGPVTRPLPRPGRRD